MSKINYWKREAIAELKFLPQNVKYLLSKKKKAIYIGCTDMGNIGDEAIFSGIQELLKGFIHLYPLSYKKPSSGRFFRNLVFNKPDYIILGGGTIIRKGEHESYLKLIKQVQKQWSKSKLLVLGPGVANPKFAEKIGFPTDIEAWKTCLNSADFISVRGNLSKSELELWGVKLPINILHDPVVFYTRSKKVIKKKNKTIALNFADIGDRIYGGDKNVIKEFALGLVEKLLKDKWTIHLYPTTKSDLDFMLNEIGLKKYKSIICYENYTDLNASLDFLSSVDFLIGQRLHSIIFSSVVCTPFFALEYELKTKEFLDTIDMVSYSSRVDKLEYKKVFKLVASEYENLDELQQKIYLRMQNVKQEQLTCRDLLLTKI